MLSRSIFSQAFANSPSGTSLHTASLHSGMGKHPWYWPYGHTCIQRDTFKVKLTDTQICTLKQPHVSNKQTQNLLNMCNYKHAHTLHDTWSLLRNSLYPHTNTFSTFHTYTQYYIIANCGNINFLSQITILYINKIRPLWRWFYEIITEPFLVFLSAAPARPGPCCYFATFK